MNQAWISSLPGWTACVHTVPYRALTLTVDIVDKGMLSYAVLTILTVGTLLAPARPELGVCLSEGLPLSRL